VTVHHERVGGRGVAAGRGIASASDAAVPVMRMMWTGQVDEARCGGRPGGRTRLASERLSTCEAARTTQQAVGLPRLGVASTM